MKKLLVINLFLLAFYQVLIGQISQGLKTTSTPTVINDAFHYNK